MVRDKLLITWIGVHVFGMHCLVSMSLSFFYGKKSFLKTGWFQHFKHHLTDVDTWIDFETEIENVLLSINTLLSKDFDSSTVSEVDVEVDVNSEYGENYQTNKAEFDSFLGDNLVQFSPRYLNEMRFKSNKVQRILRSFSITSKAYGSYEEVKDYGMSKIVNLKSHDSHGAREKAKIHKKYRDSLFITFDIDRVVKKKYLDRFSSFYTGFKADELFKRLSADLECFSEIFSHYGSNFYTAQEIFYKRYL